MRGVRRAVDDPPQQRHLVLDLGVGTAQRGGDVVTTERPADEGDEQLLLRTLVRHERRLEPGHEVPDGSQVRCVVGERVRDGPDVLDVGQHRVVLGAQPAGHLGVLLGQRRCVESGREDRPQGDADGEHVDPLLEDGAGSRRQQPDGRRDHRDE